MLRRFGAGVAVLALLYGFVAAPYTHAHHAIDSAGDEHHPHGQTLVHTHATPHAHEHADVSHHDADDGDPYVTGKDEDVERIWSVDSFVLQRAVPGHAPAPILVVFGESHVELTSVWLGAHRLQPRAHGPPVAVPVSLRAPPAFLPTFA